MVIENRNTRSSVSEPAQKRQFYTLTGKSFPFSVSTPNTSRFSTPSAKQRIVRGNTFTPREIPWQAASYQTPLVVWNPWQSCCSFKEPTWSSESRFKDRNEFLVVYKLQKLNQRIVLNSNSLSAQRPMTTMSDNDKNNKNQLRLAGGISIPYPLVPHLGQSRSIDQQIKPVFFPNKSVK